MTRARRIQIIQHYSLGEPKVSKKMLHKVKGILGSGDPGSNKPAKRSLTKNQIRNTREITIKGKDGSTRLHNFHTGDA